MKRTVLTAFTMFMIVVFGLAAAAHGAQPNNPPPQGGQTAKDPLELFGRIAGQLGQAARPMTEKEEYVIGRAVAAQILERYPLLQNEQLTTYVNEVGMTLALASDVPYTYGGYHVGLLDTPEVNALSCPGGIIFLTRGMLAQFRNEEELAAALAHEVAHVNHRDGIQAIQRNRWIQVVSMLGGEAVKGREGLDQLTVLFEGSVNDIFRTLIVNGYSQEQERAADQAAIGYLSRAGYDPFGLQDYLQKLSTEQAAGKRGGFLTTHPGIGERLTLVKSALSQKGIRPTDHRARDQRFSQAMK